MPRFLDTGSINEGVRCKSFPATLRTPVWRGIVHAIMADHATLKRRGGLAGHQSGSAFHATPTRGIYERLQNRGFDRLISRQKSTTGQDAGPRKFQRPVLRLSPRAERHAIQFSRSSSSGGHSMKSPHKRDLQLLEVRVSTTLNEDKRRDYRLEPIIRLSLFAQV